MNHSHPEPTLATSHAKLTAKISFALLLCVAMLTGCGTNTATGPAVEQDSSASGASAGNGTGAAGLAKINESLAYKLPEGNAEKLLEFINELSVQQPKGATDEERNADIANIFTARAAAADRIVNGPEANSYGTIAARIKLESLRVLTNVGQPNAAENLQAYAKELLDNKSEDLKRVGRYGMFSISLDKLMANPQSEGKSVIDQVNKFVESEPRDQELLFLINEAADTFGMSGREPQARQLLKLIADTFAENTNEQLAAQGKEAQAKLHMAELQDHLIGVMQGAEGAEDNLTNGVNEVLESSPSSASLGVVMDLSQKLENSGRQDIAAKLYNQLEETLDNATSADEMTSMIREGVERANTRMNLVGKELDLQGKTVFGKDFDWSDYRGKVVLVDFWATWCGPCLEEIPNLINLHERYSSQGFDIVGINLDNEVAAAVNFLEDQALPWESVMSPGDGQQNTNAAELGVETIPFIMLVDDKGKVVATHLRGEKIGEVLGDMFESDDADVVIELDDEEVESANTDTVEADVQPASEDQSAIQPARTGKEPDAKWELALAPQDTEQPLPESNLTKEQTESNPYEPDAGLSVKQLIAFILDMQDKTRSIQFRDGFREGVCIAADRVLDGDDASRRHREIAAEAKLNYLHRDACLGDDDADKFLREATGKLAKEPSEKTQRLVRFFEMERKALDAADTPPENEWHSETWKTSIEYLQSEKESLASQHLRMSSSLVEILNENPDVEEREKDFLQLSELLSASEDPALRRYGKRIGPKTGGEKTDWIGKPLELAGTTIDGEDFSAKEFLGKVVVVDFWATWCGPCRAAMPELQALYKKHHTAGLEVIGVSLDHDEDALAEYLNDNELPWTHITGESATELAKKYDVAGIPAMLLVDQNGKIVGRGRTAREFLETIESLLDVDDK